MALAQRFLARSGGCSGGYIYTITSRLFCAESGLQKTELPTITQKVGQAFPGDLRSSSALGLGDGITSHTEKWLQPDGKTPTNSKSPMEYIAETEPIKVKGSVVASMGTDDPALGCPVEYINLKGTSYDRPAVCKYTGNKYYSDDWRKYGTKE